MSSIQLASRPTRWGRTGGFSLPELLVALGLLSLVMAAAVGLSSGLLARLRLEYAARDLASNLRNARTFAASVAQPAALTFDVAGNRYAEAAKSRVIRLPRGVTFADPLGQNPVSFVSTSSADSAAVFNSRGRLLSRATPASAHLGVKSQALYYRVSVGVLGSVTVEQWKHGRWQ